MYVQFRIFSSFNIPVSMSVLHYTIENIQSMKKVQFIRFSFFFSYFFAVVTLAKYKRFGDEFFFFLVPFLIFKKLKISKRITSILIFLVITFCGLQSELEKYGG